MAQTQKQITQKSSNEASLSNLVAIVGWIAGVIVALAVGFGMIDKVLRVRFLPTTFTTAVGWLVVILTIVGAIIAIIDKLKR